ncbi:hypothetical protein GA0070563_12935, partial [Micromonospora carbonacea]
LTTIPTETALTAIPAPETTLTRRAGTETTLTTVAAAEVPALATWRALVTTVPATAGGP